MVPGKQDRSCRFSLFKLVDLVAGIGEILQQEDRENDRERAGS